MITGFDHGYWLTSPISTWPQTFWASTFPCLSWLLLQPCRKWLILMVQTSAKLRFSTHFSKGKFSCRNYLECRRACYGKSSSLCRNNNGLKYHTACGTSVMTQTLINCADPMTDLMVFFSDIVLMVYFQRWRGQLSWARDTFLPALCMHYLHELARIIAYALFITLILPWIICLHQVYKDRNIVRQLVKRAELAGFKAIALTVDTPILGRREADIKNRCESNNWTQCAGWMFIVSIRSPIHAAYVLWNHADSPYLHIWRWKTLKRWILARWTRLPENWAWHRAIKMHLFLQVFLPNISWCVRQTTLALLPMLLVKLIALFPGRYYLHTLAS